MRIAACFVAINAQRIAGYYTFVSASGAFRSAAKYDRAVGLQKRAQPRHRPKTRYSAWPWPVAWPAVLNQECHPCQQSNLPLSFAARRAKCGPGIRTGKSQNCWPQPYCAYAPAETRQSAAKGAKLDLALLPTRALLRTRLTQLRSTAAAGRYATANHCQSLTPWQIERLAVACQRRSSLGEKLVSDCFKTINWHPMSLA